MSDEADSPLEQRGEHTSTEDLQHEARDLVRKQQRRAWLRRVAIGVLGALAFVGVVLVLSPTTFAYPAQYALLPRVVGRSDLQQANALLVVGNQAALILGPPAAAGVFYLWGPVSALSADAGSFLVSAIALMAMGSAARFADDVERASAARARFVAVWADTIAGLRYIVASPLLVGNAVTVSGLSIAAGLNSTAMIFFVSNELGRSPGDVAWLSSANGVAQVLTGGIMVVMAQAVRPQLVLLAGAALLAVGGGVVASAFALPILILGVIVTALGNAPFNIATSTVEQEFVASDYLGRARGSLDVLASALFLAAAGIAGYLVNVVGARPVLVASAGALTLVLVVTAFILVPVIGKLRSATAARAN